MNQPVRCVIDANVGIKRFINDPLTPKVRSLIDTLVNPQTEIFVPDLFYIELTNIFWKYVRAGLYTSSQVQTDLTLLKTLPLRVVPTTDLILPSANIAIEYQISAYDACYVALSQQVQAPLLTLDNKMVKALLNSTFNIVDFADFTIFP